MSGDVPQASLLENDSIQEAEEYIRKHRINELFQDLCTHLCVVRPEKIETFLIEQLKLRQKQGARFSLYSESELQNVFTLFDLRGEGYITKEQTKKALCTLAHSEFHFTEVHDAQITDKVDSYNFMKLCDKILGIKHSQQSEDE